MLNKKIVKLQADYDIPFENGDGGIYFLGGDRYTGFDLQDVLRAIVKNNKEYLNNNLTEEEILVTYIKSKMTIPEIWGNYLDEYNKENFEDYEDFLGKIERSDDYLTEIVAEKIKREEIEEMVNMFNCTFGTVGYSQWSYYVSSNNTNTGYIRDVWEGWHFYGVIILDENGEELDSLWGVYITDTEELLQTLDCNFGISKDDFLLVDNEESTYFDVAKIKEVKHINYSYSEIY